jgi:hypothetical protein
MEMVQCNSAGERLYSRDPTLAKASTRFVNDGQKHRSTNPLDNFQQKFQMENESVFEEK